MHYVLQKCRRKPITAQQLCENPDLQGWLYSKEMHDLGLDPWRMITGVDADRLNNPTKIFLDYGICSEKEVSPDYTVYIHNGEQL